MNSYNNPFDSGKPIVGGHDHHQNHDHGDASGCRRSHEDEVKRDYEKHQTPEFRGMEHFHGESGCGGARRDGGCHNGPDTHKSDDLASEEKVIERVVENAVMRAIFPDDMQRREFLRRVGQAAAISLIGSVFPLARAKAFAADPVKPGDIEKKDLSVGFIPITCATPIIMAEPMGFYQRHGLNVTVRRAAGWAMVRDWAINGDVDAAHMLSPMPLSITLGAGSQPVNFFMPAIENINGQAITLANKHRGVRGPRDMKGFRFCVPFDYSMHNYLLRYYLAEGGLHPDRDVQIRVVPPPEMVANLSAGNVDGYLAPDPFNQRAVYENVGFIYKLTKDIWDGHPCCAFAVSEQFTRQYPNTFKALFRSIVDATYFSADPENRREIARAIAPANYLNQPPIVLEQVLTGRYADGQGGIQNVPGRIDFDPMPWQAMAKWILTQMVRWGQVAPDVNYDRIARQVYLEADCRDMIEELGYESRRSEYNRFNIMGKPFDASEAESYARSFSISNL